jgi:hypothetical protein
MRCGRDPVMAPAHHPSAGPGQAVGSVADSLPWRGSAAAHIAVPMRERMNEGREKKKRNKRKINKLTDGSYAFEEIINGLIRDENGTDIFRPYSIPNSFRGVQICPYPSPDIQHPIPYPYPNTQITYL